MWAHTTGLIRQDLGVVGTIASNYADEARKALADMKEIMESSRLL